MPETSSLRRENDVRTSFIRKTNFHLEIYDSVWHTHGDDTGKSHSKKATDAVKGIILYLMDN